MESSRNNIDDSLLAKYLEGSTSAQEKAEVESWIVESSDNREVFDHFKAIWTKSQAVAFDSELKFDKKNAFDNVMSRIEQASVQEEKTPSSAKSLLLTFIVRAAAFFIFGITFYFIYQNYIKSHPEEIVIASAESHEVVMPDSSIITLNTSAKINYAENFLENRKLTLQGEAFFEVKNQENQSFTVKAEDLEVKVLGTSFYIIALPNDNFIEVGVKTGRVEVAQISGEKSVILEANEWLTYNKYLQSFDRSQEYNNNKLFWKTGVLEFNDKPLEEVFLTLSQVYKREVNFRQSELDNCRFTGRFKDVGLEEILEQLQISFNFEIDIDKEVNISGKACEQ